MRGCLPQAASALHVRPLPRPHTADYPDSRLSHNRAFQPAWSPGRESCKPQRRSRQSCCVVRSADSSTASTSTNETAPRDDDVLPDSLSDALAQASRSTTAAIESGASRCLVELLLPDLWDPISGALFSEEGDQQRFWKLTRRFAELLMEAAATEGVKVLYPDLGVAAMLKNQWSDAQFGIASVNDRQPVSPDDKIIVVAAADPQGLSSTIKVVDSLKDTPAVLFNPRLASGDVGIGLNVRRMRTSFLSTFTITYSLCPIGDIGTVYRRYPGAWQVFLVDPATPGRYRLASESQQRPAGDSLEEIISNEVQEQSNGGGPASKPGLLDQVGATIGSMQRFMKSLSQ